MNITPICELCDSEARGFAEMEGRHLHLCYDHLREYGVAIRKPGPDYDTDSEGRRIFRAPAVLEGPEAVENLRRDRQRVVSKLTRP